MIDCLFFFATILLMLGERKNLNLTIKSNP